MDNPAPLYSSYADCLLLSQNAAIECKLGVLINKTRSKADNLIKLTKPYLVQDPSRLPEPVLV